MNNFTDFVLFFLYGISLYILAQIIKFIYTEFNATQNFHSLNKKYKTKWEVLNTDEKIVLLYAFHGKEFNDSLDEKRKIYTDESYITDQDIGIRSTMLDGIYDWQDDILKKCKIYEKLPNNDLEIEFEKILENHIGEFDKKRCYDKEFTMNLLDHIFSNKSKYYKLIKDSLNE